MRGDVVFRIKSFIPTKMNPSRIGEGFFIVFKRINSTFIDFSANSCYNYVLIIFDCCLKNELKLLRRTPGAMTITTQRWTKTANQE